MFDKDWKLMNITGKWFVVLCDHVVRFVSKICQNDQEIIDCYCCCPYSLQALGIIFLYLYWKAASAIRRIAYYEPLTHMASILGVEVSNRTLYFTHMAGVHLLAALMPMMAFWITSLGEWFSYLIFAHRRYLKDNDTSIISQYFGFTTLGVNGSITSEIRSKISSMTSSVEED